MGIKTSAMDKTLSNGLFTYRVPNQKTTAQLGRPRAFDPDVALDRAMGTRVG